MPIKFSAFFKYFLILIIISSSTSAIAATPSATSNCIIHLDKSFYVTGEIIWYKVYLTQDFKTKPVTIRATILDASGTIQHSSFINTEGNTFIQGYYKIPFNNKSGMYLLRFSGVNKANKQQVVLVESQIPIYNDLEGVAKLVKNESSNPPAAPSQIPSTDDLTVSIQLPKNLYRTRQKVQPIITIKDNNGNPVASNISVSVVDWDMVGNDMVGIKTLREGNTLNPKVISIFSDDIYLNGIVSKEVGDPHTAKILGAYSRDEDKILYTKSNQDGKFFLRIPKFYGTRSFQFLGQQSEYENIRVKKNKQLAINNYQALPFNDLISNYLRLSRQRKKIFQHYSSLESNLVTETTRLSKKELKADVSFIIKEYEDFEFMSIFFKENLTPLRFQFQSDSTYLARMYKS